MSLLFKLKTLCSWLPIIWNDSPYDRKSLYLVLKHKLQQLQQSFSTVPFSGDDEEKSRIKKCIHQLDLLIKDDFCKTEYEDHNKYWDSIECLPDDEKKECLAELSAICTLEEKRRDQTIKSLLLSIANNYKKWWY